MKILAALILALGIPGCMTAQQNTATNVEYACASATAALKTVILFNDKLTPATRAGVTRAVAVVNPVCSQPNVPTLDSTATAALAGALSQLTVAATEATR